VVAKWQAKCAQMQNLHSDAIQEAKTLHTQEIHELKSEIKELRDLLVGGLGNSLTHNLVHCKLHNKLLLIITDMYVCGVEK
jgi:hypothetical protein